MPCDLCFSHSENTQYQMLYSCGAGVIHVLGVVPQSHLKVLTLSVEDGEVIEQVVLDYGSKIANLIWTNAVCGVVSVSSFFKNSFAVDAFISWCLSWQTKVAAPWLKSLNGACGVVGEAVLVCADTATHSLYVCSLETEQEMKQIPLQVSSAERLHMQLSNWFGAWLCVGAQGFFYR